MFSYFFLRFFPLFSRFLAFFTASSSCIGFPLFLFLVLLNINNEYVTVYIVLIALFFIYFLILNYSPLPLVSASSVCLRVYFCFLTKTNRYLLVFYFSHFFSRVFSFWTWRLSSILDWQHKKYSSTVCVCVRVLQHKKMKSFKWW